MIHRGTAQAFAGDSRARQVLRVGLAQGFDHDLPAIRWGLRCASSWNMPRTWLCRTRRSRASARCATRLRLPSVRCSTATWITPNVTSRVIRRFGRFPHRNALLGRVSSPQELAFLEEPGSRF